MNGVYLKIRVVSGVGYHDSNIYKKRIFFPRRCDFVYNYDRPSRGRIRCPRMYLLRNKSMKLVPVLCHGKFVPGGQFRCPGVGSIDGVYPFSVTMKY